MQFSHANHGLCQSVDPNTTFFLKTINVLLHFWIDHTKGYSINLVSVSLKTEIVATCDCDSKVRVWWWLWLLTSNDIQSQSQHSTLTLPGHYLLHIGWEWKGQADVNCLNLSKLKWSWCIISALETEIVATFCDSKARTGVLLMVVGHDIQSQPCLTIGILY